MTHHYDDFFDDYPLNHIPLSGSLENNKESNLEERDDKTSNAIKDGDETHNDSERPVC